MYLALHFQSCLAFHECAWVMQTLQIPLGNLLVDNSLMLFLVLFHGICMRGFNKEFYSVNNCNKILL